MSVRRHDECARHADAGPLGGAAACVVAGGRPARPNAARTKETARSTADPGPRDLRAVALRFQQAAPATAVGQIASTLPPLLALLAAMHVGLALGWWPVLTLALPAAGFTVRSFILQHDCGHGSFLPSRRANDALARFCSLLTFTPYGHWRRQHARHHGTWNDLDRRDRGADIYSTCLTVAEYRALPPWRRRLYRWARHPVVALLLLPPVIFLVLCRLPFDTAGATRHERRSVHLTNLALLVLYGGLGLLLGFGQVAAVTLAVMVPASIIGVSLFSVQHRFEDAYWARHDEWDPVAAAIEGSSFLRLPQLLQWFTGSIGFHHVHHLAPRVPNYRLEACHRAHPAFAAARVITLREGLSASRYVLWDEKAGRMTTFAAMDLDQGDDGAPVNRRAGMLALAVLSLGGLAGSFARAEAPSAIPPPGLVDDIRGVWMTMEEVAVDIADCGRASELCGRIIWLRVPRDAAGRPKRDEMNPIEALQARPLCGLTVLQGLRPTGPDNWGGGAFYDPRDGGTYRIRLTLGTADALIALVYVGVPLFGRSQLLVRVNRLSDDGWC